MRPVFRGTYRIYRFLSTIVIRLYIRYNDSALVFLRQQFCSIHIFISRHIARNPYKPHQKKYYHLKSKSNSNIMKGSRKTHFHRRNGK